MSTVLYGTVCVYMQLLFFLYLDSCFSVFHEFSKKRLFTFFFLFFTFSSASVLVYKVKCEQQKLRKIYVLLGMQSCLRLSKTCHIVINRCAYMCLFSNTVTWYMSSGCPIWSSCGCRCQESLCMTMSNTTMTRRSCVMRPLH